MNEDTLLEELRRLDPLEGVRVESASDPRAQETLRRILATKAKPPTIASAWRRRLGTSNARRTATIVVAFFIALVGVAVPLWTFWLSGRSEEPAAPAEGLIAFSGFQASGDSSNPEDIFVVSPEGTGQVRLTHDASSDTGPSWSPDGTRIAFAREEQGTDFLYVMDADGQSATRLGPGDHPSWSPTGDRIVYVEGTRLGVMNADGTGAQPIRDDGPSGFSGSPVWSPDGQQIAFLRVPVSDEFGFAYLYVMSENGTNVRRVSETTILSLTDGIAWSPDGTTILFTGSDYELHAVHPDGSNETILTDASSSGPGSVTVSISPAWSSDGTFIAFVRNPVPGEDHEVFTMRADGTGVRQVTNDDIEVSSLSWQPVNG